MLLNITLFTLFACSLFSYCKAVYLRRGCYLLTGFFVLFQLTVIEIKHDYAGYIDYEEGYYSFSSSLPSVIDSPLNAMLSALNPSAWFNVVGSGLFILILVTLFMKLLERAKLRCIGGISLRTLLVISLGCASFVSSITLYRYTFVAVRTLVSNALVINAGVEKHDVTNAGIALNINTDTNSDTNAQEDTSTNSTSRLTTDVMLALKSTSFGSDYSVIAHATGGTLMFDANQPSLTTHASPNITHLKYSNSLQALHYSIQDGKKLIEVDLLSTTDGVLIGGHDWPRVKAMLGYNGVYDRNKHDAAALSFEEFDRLRALSDIKPLDIHQINAIFKQNHELVLITDKTQDYASLVKYYDFPERLIVECFNLFQCKRARQLGIRHAALNVYMSNRDLVNYLDRNNVAIVTYRNVTEQDAVSYQNAININKAGVITLVYTSADNIEQMQQSIGFTASAIYTDYFSLQGQSLVTD